MGGSLLSHDGPGSRLPGEEVLLDDHLPQLLVRGRVAGGGAATAATGEHVVGGAEVLRAVVAMLLLRRASPALHGPLAEPLVPIDWVCMCTRLPPHMHS